MGRVEGKVALVTGAARGQGRAHSVRLAEEGADVIAVDVCAPVEGIQYPAATPEDLAETERQVRALGRRIVTRQLDVRDVGALEAAVADGVSELGRLDVVAANAGIVGPFKPAWELTEPEWRTEIDVDLTGAWVTVRAAVPAIIAGDRGGAIVMTGSTAALTGFPTLAHYAAAKHGLVGLARTLALELAPQRIRVNTVHPTNVRTPMLDNELVLGAFRPDLEQPTLDDARDALAVPNLLPTPWVEARDIANALLWLVSDEARYVSGVALPVDAGFLQK